MNYRSQIGTILEQPLDLAIMELKELLQHETNESLNLWGLKRCEYAFTTRLASGRAKCKTRLGELFVYHDDLLIIPTHKAPAGRPGKKSKSFPPSNSVNFFVPPQRFSVKLMSKMECILRKDVKDCEIPTRHQTMKSAPLFLLILMVLPLQVQVAGEESPEEITLKILRPKLQGEQVSPTWIEINYLIIDARHPAGIEQLQLWKSGAKKANALSPK